MADEWQREFLPQNQRGLEGAGNANSDRALQNTSGNIQSYSDTLAHHSDVTGRDDHLQQLAYKYPQPPPAPTHLVHAPATLFSRPWLLGSMPRNLDDYNPLATILVLPVGRGAISSLISTWSIGHGHDAIPEGMETQYGRMSLKMLSNKVRPNCCWKPVRGMIALLTTFSS